MKFFFIYLYNVNNFDIGGLLNRIDVGLCNCIVFYDVDGLCVCLFLIFIFFISVWVYRRLWF